METKICTRCEQEKELKEFIKDSRYVKGVRGQCKNCLRELKNERYWRNPEKYRKIMKDYLARTPELTKKRRIRAYIKYLENRGFKVLINT